MTDDVVAAVRAHLTAQFGGLEPAAASVTFLGLEPIDILRFPYDGTVVRYASLGCSRHPMGDPGDMIADNTHGPRAELVLTLRSDVGADSGIHRTLAVLAAAPAVEGIVLLPDALIDLGEPLWRNSSFTAVLLDHAAIDELPLPEPAEPVKFHQVTPLTQTEAAWVRLRGAAALREAWAEAAIDTADPNRLAATL